LELAEAVCAEDGEPSADILDALTGLVDKSLVVARAQGEVMRYSLLETIRMYAALRLADSGADARTRRRHCEAYVALSEQGEPELRGAKQLVWFNRLDAEHDNVRAALAWLLEQGDGDQAVRLSGAQSFFWYVRGYYNEGRGWLARVLTLSARSTVQQAKVLNGAGLMAMAQGDFEEATALHEQALELQRRLGDTPGVVVSLRGLGNVAHRQSDYGRAALLLREGLALQRQLGDTWGMAAS
jgi:non-specific serine/threonine protein kinase